MTFLNVFLEFSTFLTFNKISPTFPAGVTRKFAIRCDRKHEQLTVVTRCVLFENNNASERIKFKQAVLVYRAPSTPLSL